MNEAYDRTSVVTFKRDDARRLLLSNIIKYGIVECDALKCMSCVLSISCTAQLSHL